MPQQVQIVLPAETVRMIFSKSFGYALRSILYIALLQDEKRYVQAEEIALNLGVPRHFVGKILKKLTKANLLVSVKGPSGGFKVNGKTSTTTLLQLYRLIDGPLPFQHCVLRMNECNASNPCPVHHQVIEIKNRFASLLTETTVCELIKGGDKAGFIRSISSEEEMFYH